MEISNSSDQPLPALLQEDKDPYAVYGILNNTKNDILFGLAIADDDEEMTQKSTRCRRDTYSDRWSSPVADRVPSSTNVSPLNQNNNSAAPHGRGSHQVAPVRRESTMSMVSLASSNGDSSNESDIAEEAQDYSSTSDGTDSALGAEDSPSTVGISPPPAQTVSDASTQLKGHLMGLYSCLTQLSDTAAYITERYQEEISK